MSKLVRSVAVAAMAVGLATGTAATAAADTGSSGSASGSAASLPCQIQTLLMYGTLSAGEGPMYNIPACRPF